MNKREEIRAQRRQDMIMQWIIPVVIVILGIFIVSGVLFYNSTVPQKAVIMPQVVSRPSAVGNTAGDPNAPVTVEALEDFQCPFCSQYTFQTEPQIMETYVATGMVYYKFTPFSFLGAESFTAAEAAYCAMDQGKFWDYHDYLYANQDGENKGAFNSKRLEAIAGELKLDMGKFKECTSSRKYGEKVNQDRSYASKNGATGSPVFLVNGTLVSLENLNTTIHAALAAKK